VKLHPFAFSVPPRFRFEEILSRQPGVAAELKYSKINKWSETAFNWKQVFAVLAGEAAWKCGS
jgi:hypothetical protein